MINIRTVILVVGLLFLPPVVLGSGQQEQGQDPEQQKQQKPDKPTRPNRGSAGDLGLELNPDGPTARTRSEALRKSARGKAFEVPPPADVAAPPEDALRTESGLAYREIRAGANERPGPTDMVLVHLNVWTPDGSLFDSSVMRDTPINFRLDLTIPAFAELLPLMGRGAKWWIWSPQEMATLDENSNVDSPLVFEVELIDFLVKPETPPDVSAPPRDARKTFLGVSYTVLQPGSGDRRPKSGEWVEIHYAGWTRDGEMFDSSFDYGRPRSFPVNEKMPPGWNDVLKEMLVGEKRRVWIPEDLAVSQHKDRPMGTLVFDIELLSIRESE